MALISHLFNLDIIHEGSLDQNNLGKTPVPNMNNNLHFLNIVIIFGAFTYIGVIVKVYLIQKFNYVSLIKRRSGE